LGALLREGAEVPVGGRPGCAYAARCPFVIDRCRLETPEIRAVQPNHYARCHRTEELELSPLPSRPVARSA
jgi:peptide/nickel transport system ATP-binding protein